MTTPEPPGQVITFYSYKGGTGRSMALCSVACLLARRCADAGRRGVLVVDWDLEAPGLHRFFRDHLTGEIGPGPRVDGALASHPGLLDLFQSLSTNLPTTKPSSRAQAAEVAKAALAPIELGQYTMKTDIPSLSLMTAGRLDHLYSTRVNQFQWEDLFRRAPAVFLDVAHLWSRYYDYVLIDSRTGLTDISGICTMLMPERLVVVFTPNRQSLTGLSDLVRRALAYRDKSDDLRPLVVFPLASRVEATEPALGQRWRFGDASLDVEGYQTVFQSLLQEAYQLPECTLTSYFGDVVIQHVPRYAYGEDVPVLVEAREVPSGSGSERLSLTRSYEAFTDRLIYLQGPWEDWEIGQARKTADEADRFCERAFETVPAVARGRVLRFLTRLVRVALPDETVNHARADATLRIFPDDVVPWLRWLADEKLLVIDRHPSSGDEIVSFASDTIVREWGRLRVEVDGQRDFLLWRRRLGGAMVEWLHSNRDAGTRLTGTRFAEASDWLSRREADLTDEEIQFIRASATEIPPALESPGGAMRPDSAIYIERTSERLALQEIHRGGAIIVISGPRGYGKTSLLVRLLAAARRAGDRVALVDLTTMDRSVSAEHFFRGFCTIIAEEFGLDVVPSDLSGPRQATRFLERDVLGAIGERAILALDEVDVIVGTPYGDALLAMLRSWSSLRGVKDGWDKLSLIVAGALEPAYLIASDVQSPFNVGTSIHLEPFNVSETAELNRRHGSPLNARQLDQLAELLGGAPDLVHRALYVAATGQMSPDELLARAADESGPFADRLARLEAGGHLLLAALAHVARGEAVSAALGQQLLRGGFVRREVGRGGVGLAPVGTLYSTYALRRVG